MPTLYLGIPHKKLRCTARLMNMPRLPSSKPHEKVRTTYGTENLRLAPVTDNCLNRAAPGGLVGKGGSVGKGLTEQA